MKKKALLSGTILVLLVVIVSGAFKLAQKKQGVELIRSTDTLETEDLTLLERMYFDVFNDGKDESIELYTSAERGPDGLMWWDTGHRWLLLVRNKDKIFPLFDDWVQHGQIEFCVVAFNKSQIVSLKDEDLETHIYVMRNGQEICLFDCYWDKRNHYFKT